MSLLKTIILKKKQKPISMIFYGVHGIGKTSFPMGAPSPIYIGSEESDEFDIARFPKVETWEDFTNQLKTLRDEQHEFKTLVIDTMDTLEQVAQKEILSGTNYGKTMATAMGGFGKAYEKMSDMFLDIRDNYLIKLRDEKNMNIVILCHADKGKFEDPITNSTYDFYSTSLHKKIKPIFEDWVSAILFANYYLIKSEKEGKEIVENIGGKRIIYTEERPSYVGKNRFGLPHMLEFPKSGAWKILENHINNYFSDSNFEILKKEADELLKNVNEELKGLVARSLRTAYQNKDCAEVQRVINKIKQES